MSIVPRCTGGAARSFPRAQTCPVCWSRTTPALAYARRRAKRTACGVSVVEEPPTTTSYR